MGSARGMLWAATVWTAACWGCSLDRSGLGAPDGRARPTPDDASAADVAPPWDARVRDASDRADAARDAEAPDAEARDAGFDPCVDAPVPDTFETCPFEDVARIDAVSEPGSSEDDPTLTADLCEMYFESTRFGAPGDIFVTRRESPAHVWEDPQIVDELSTTDGETTPEVSPDGLTIWFASNRPGGPGGHDIWVSTRADRSSPWSTPTLVTELSTEEVDVAASPSRDGLQATVSIRPAGSDDWDLFLATRPSTGDAWGPLAPLDEINTSGMELDAYFDASALHLFFDTDFGGADRDLAVASRPSLAGSFGAAVTIAGANSTAAEQDPWLSDDLRYIVFASNRDGSWDIYEARR